jgi:hypothetical protein
VAHEPALEEVRQAYPEFTKHVAGWTPEQRDAVVVTLRGLGLMLSTIAEDPAPELGGNPVVQATLLGVHDTVVLMQAVARGR